MFIAMNYLVINFWLLKPSTFNVFLVHSFCYLYTDVSKIGLSWYFWHCQLLNIYFLTKSLKCFQVYLFTLKLNTTHPPVFLHRKTFRNIFLFPLSLLMKHEEGKTVTWNTNKQKTNKLCVFITRVKVKRVDY